ncbi:hypothetical protein ACIRBX_24925 [Kitasatospora sp. NPDC096147]|uniref:hypothetical protein n=1 Tax=Kitasatospora sp. NPDC096147 TaxID=3364093 RepID=UPI0038306A90
MEIWRTIEGLVAAAEQQIRDGVWELNAVGCEVAWSAAADLAAVVGSPSTQQALAPIERLGDLREALAVLAVALARVHGRLAWVLASASDALSPVLHWRALPVGEGYDFGTVEPTEGEYAEAEGAVRLLHDFLVRVTTA